MKQFDRMYTRPDGAVLVVFSDDNATFVIRGFAIDGTLLPAYHDGDYTRADLDAIITREGWTLKESGAAP